MWGTTGWLSRAVTWSGVRLQKAAVVESGLVGVRTEGERPVRGKRRWCPDQGWTNKGSEEWSDPGSILKMGPPGFLDGRTGVAGIRESKLAMRLGA